MLSFVFWIGEKHLILGTAKKGIFDYRPKDLILWKRGSTFVSTEDRNLWIPSRIMWFDQTRPTEAMAQMVQHP